jgi:hypothetical protein
VDGTQTADTGPGPTVDTTDTGAPPLPADGWPTESTVVPQPAPGGCGCGTGGVRGAWILALLALRRRSRA